MSSKSFWQTIPKPIIGLAPMDGYTDSPFRRICQSVRPDLLVYTEFTSADGLHHKAKKLQKKLWFHESETPILAQIFGKNTDSYISAARYCEEAGFTGIDINMGCPAKKVVRSEHGIALRKSADLAFKLIETLATHTHLPISVKTRLGWSDASDLITFGLGAQNAGADMICIHARTYLEPYNVPADFNPVYELKFRLTIPVLANGGVVSIEDGLQKIGNLDGFLIGQASFGNPWVFESPPTTRTIQDKIPTIKQHARWMVEHKGERAGVSEMRKHLLSYIKSFPGSKTYRTQFATVSSLAQIEALLDQLVTTPQP